MWLVTVAGFAAGFLRDRRKQCAPSSGRYCFWGRHRNGCCLRHRNCRRQRYFSIAEVRIGVAGTIIIPQLNDAIGVRQVRRYALTAERFDVKEALRIGLVHEIVPLAELQAAGERIVKQLLANGPEAVAQTIGAVMQPAGLEKGVGIISAGYHKDPTDPQWQDTPEYKEWLAWMKKYNSSPNVRNSFTVYGYSAAQTLVAVLKASGDNLTRENVMHQAASIHDLKVPMLLPGREDCSN